MTNARYNKLKVIGKNALNSIRDTVAALKCDYDRLKELRNERDSHTKSISDASTPKEAKAFKKVYQDWLQENEEELTSLEGKADGCEGQDAARQRIEEDPLSIEFRTAWISQRETVERDDWAEACILLATGGPAVQIMVELNDGQPHRAYLQVQDWGTPWTNYYEAGCDELLMNYVNVFCWE